MCISFLSQTVIVVKKNSGLKRQKKTYILYACLERNSLLRLLSFRSRSDDNNKIAYGLNNYSRYVVHLLENQTNILETFSPL